MNISKTIDQASDSLEKVDWKQLTKEIVDLWVAFFKVIVTLAVLTYLIGKHLGQGIHLLNDWLAAKWLQVLGLTSPTELGRASPTTVEIVVVEVETMLPLESLSTLFNTPLMLAAAQAPVALLAQAVVVQEQQSPAPRRRRRKSSPPAVAVNEASTTPTRRSRGRRAHDRRHKAA